MILVIADDYFIKDKAFNDMFKDTQKNAIIGLALWPDAERAFNENDLKYLTPLDLIKNEDHEHLAKLIINISNNWWKACFPDEIEPSIDGLPISQLYPCEIEANLSPVIYNIVAINRAITHYKVDELIFITKKIKSLIKSVDILLNPEGFTNIIGSIPIGEFFISVSDRISEDNISILQQQDKNGVSKIIRNYYYRIRRILTLLALGYFHKLFLEVKEKYSSKYMIAKEGEILILSGSRCLSGFIDCYQNSSKISFIPYKYLLDSYLTEYKSSFNFSFNRQNISFTYEGLNFTRLIEYIYDYSKYHFTILQMHYNELIKVIEKINPSAYITIDVTKSLARLNAWGFSKSHIRTIWHGDGIGYITNELYDTLESAWWPKGPTEKWLFSRYFADLSTKWGIPDSQIRVTGYLDRNYNDADYCNKRNIISASLRRDILYKYFGIRENQKVILFVESIIHPTFYRFISSETIFEILKVNENIVDCLGHDESYFVIFKLHPRSEDYIHLFRKKIPKKNNMKIVSYIPVEELIHICDLVILNDSSVGLEALYRGKNLLIYNYINRPGGVSGIYEKLNHDPQKGPAARLAFTKEQLLEEAQELLKYSIHNTVSPGLEYLLENSSENYSFAKIIQKLAI